MTDRFHIHNTVYEARRGTLAVRPDTSVPPDLETPHLFPVVNFYGGGREAALYGGGIHRTIKEFMFPQHEANANSALLREVGDCSDLFTGVMTSISSIEDYTYNKEVLGEYLSNPIREQPPFRSFDGSVFVDSGGYKIMKQGEDANSGQEQLSDFSTNSKEDKEREQLDTPAPMAKPFQESFDQERVYRRQRKMGGDLLVNLDYPIEQGDGVTAEQKKARKTAKNAAKFARLTERDDFSGLSYLTVHGFTYSRFKQYFRAVDEELGSESISEAYDGIAIGSMVGKKDSYRSLIGAVMACREVMIERNLSEMPLHVLGISNGSIPLLVALGVDSFDSSSYFQAAINGKFHRSFAETSSYSEDHFQKFDCPVSCPVCEHPGFVSQIVEDDEDTYDKDVAGPIAIHNLAIQQASLEKLRREIKANDQQRLRKHLEEMLGENERAKGYLPKVLNQQAEVTEFG